MNILENAEANSNGWVTDNIKCYRQNEDEIFSVYVGTNDGSMSADDADELLQKNDIGDASFIETDESVAQEIGFAYCFVFHLDS